MDENVHNMLKSVEKFVFSFIDSACSDASKNQVNTTVAYKKSKRLLNLFHFSCNYLIVHPNKSISFTLVCFSKSVAFTCQKGTGC